ncbi:hypothetical protein [Alistipes sp. D31t1_170403_E11]|uniref:hypothetical protein n=1 Tax=Alistipes sp. D31t1_170403_E11 TaxID=2787128 RepID=UPI00189AAABA|nr:hypothetical protein [Alistipes sp. D31t1_170403_E11]
MKKLQLWIAFVIPLLLYSCINDPGLEYTNCAAQPYIVDVAVKLVVLQKFGLKSHLSQYLMLLFQFAHIMQITKTGWMKSFRNPMI